MVPGGWGASIPARCRQLNGRPRPDLDKEIREIADSIADAEFGRQKTGDVLRIVFFNICDSEEHARTAAGRPGYPLYSGMPGWAAIRALNDARSGLVPLQLVSDAFSVVSFVPGVAR